MDPKEKLPINRILPGNCLEVLEDLPENSVDLVFADPPYNLQLRQELWRPDNTQVDGVTDDWDQFASPQEYDLFSERWLIGCRRVLREGGAIWVIGTYHNIFRIGKIMQDLGFWFLNDIIWIKSNPMPNFRGVRFTNAHETLIWASKSKDSRYTFNHSAMKAFNEDKQMRSDWTLPLCGGAERIKIGGKKAHSTQKPEALLYRVLLSSTNIGETVLDPFFGTGTTGAVAKKLHRNWIGIESEDKYQEIARQRIEAVQPLPLDEKVFDIRDDRHKAVRVQFIHLLESGYLKPGQELFFQRSKKITARIKPNGKLVYGDTEGSIHQIGKLLLSGQSCNGWEHWFFEAGPNVLEPINRLRELARKENLPSGPSKG